MPITIRKKPAAANAEGPSPLVTQPGPSELLSVEGAAAYLGVSEITVRRWLKANRIPHFRAGKQIRIDRGALVQFLHQK